MVGHPLVPLVRKLLLRPTRYTPCANSHADDAAKRPFDELFICGIPVFAELSAFFATFPLSIDIVVSAAWVLLMLSRIAVSKPM